MNLPASELLPIFVAAIAAGDEASAVGCIEAIGHGILGARQDATGWYVPAGSAINRPTPAAYAAFRLGASGGSFQQALVSTYGVGCSAYLANHGSLPPILLS